MIFVVRMLRSVLSTPCCQFVWQQATGWMVGVRFPAGVRHFCLLLSVQTGLGAHTASCPVGTEDYFSEAKATGDRNRTIRLLPGPRIVELYFHFLISLHGVFINHKDIFIITLGR